MAKWMNRETWRMFLIGSLPVQPVTPRTHNERHTYATQHKEDTMPATACVMNTAVVNKPALGARKAMGDRAAIRGRTMVTASSRRVSTVTTSQYKVSTR